MRAAIERKDEADHAGRQVGPITNFCSATNQLATNQPESDWLFAIQKRLVSHA